MHNCRRCGRVFHGKENRKNQTVIPIQLEDAPVKFCNRCTKLREAARLLFCNRSRTKKGAKYYRGEVISVTLQREARTNSNKWVPTAKDDSSLKEVRGDEAHHLLSGRQESGNIDNHHSNRARGSKSSNAHVCFSKDGADEQRGEFHFRPDGLRNQATEQNVHASYSFMTERKNLSNSLMIELKKKNAEALHNDMMKIERKHAEALCDSSLKEARGDEAHDLLSGRFESGDDDIDDYGRSRAPGISAGGSKSSSTRVPLSEDGTSEHHVHEDSQFTLEELRSQAIEERNLSASLMIEEKNLYTSLMIKIEKNEAETLHEDMIQIERKHAEAWQAYHRSMELGRKADGLEFSRKITIEARHKLAESPGTSEEEALYDASETPEAHYSFSVVEAIYEYGANFARRLNSLTLHFLAGEEKLDDPFPSPSLAAADEAAQRSRHVRIGSPLWAWSVISGYARKSGEAHEGEDTRLSTSRRFGDDYEDIPCETCNICMVTEIKSENSHIVNEKCDHKFCAGCLRQHGETMVKLGKLSIPCPQFQCTQLWSSQLCDLLLSAHELEQLAQRQVENALPVWERVYCPYKDCSALHLRPNLPASTKPSGSHDHRTVVGGVECLSCHRLFCLECQVPWHDNLTCEENERLQEDQKSDIVFLRGLAKDRKWQRCSCGYVVERSEGCNHMKCRCGKEFCYHCGGHWSSYSHLCPSLNGSKRSPRT